MSTLKVKNMDEALCIDFGTSSIRAVRRLSSGQLKVLDIGRVTQSKLDDASIRSEIHVDEHGQKIRYGEKAVVARRKEGTPSLYEASPKLWLKEPDRLGEAAAAGLDVNREQLLTGLLAYAIRAAADAGRIDEPKLKKIDIRISRPIWPESVKTAADAALNRIASKAKKLAFERNWDSVTTRVLLKYLEDAVIGHSVKADVVEPVAAAVELLPSEENLVRMCVVVDVGAGTTDIGLFHSVVPDIDSSVKSKLYPVGEPISLFKAGNVIDGIVLQLLEAQARNPSNEQLAEVRARIRGIKETLFIGGLIQVLDCDVRLKDLESHPKAKAMAKEIRNALLKLISENAERIVKLLDRYNHPIQHLDVVMAGGGGGIDFVLAAISKPVTIGHRSIKVKLTIPADHAGIKTFGASRGRMAVALGGASVDYENLVHKEPPVRTIRRGSL